MFVNRHGPAGWPNAHLCENMARTYDWFMNAVLYLSLHSHLCSWLCGQGALQWHAPPAPRHSPGRRQLAAAGAIPRKLAIVCTQAVSHVDRHGEWRNPTYEARALCTARVMH